MTLTAYFDESGINADQPVCLIAGIVHDPGDGNNFLGLGKDWLDKLAKFEIKRFHATDCNARVKEFASWPHGKSRLAFMEFAGIICEHKPYVVTSVLERTVWESAGPETKMHFRFPYHMCFDHCMQIMARWSNDQMHGEPFRLIFGEQHQYQTKAKAHYNLYKELSPWGPMLLGVDFESMDFYMALQAADLLAYEIYRWQKAVIAGTFDGKHRPAMQMMIDAGVAGIGTDYDGRVYPAVVRAKAEQHKRGHQ